MNNNKSLFYFCRYIKLSSPTLNNFIILGCVMLYSTVFLYGLDGRLSDLMATVVCRVRNVLFVPLNSQAIWHENHGFFHLFYNYWFDRLE